MMSLIELFPRRVGMCVDMSYGSMSSAVRWALCLAACLLCVGMPAWFACFPSIECRESKECPSTRPLCVATLCFAPGDVPIDASLPDRSPPESSLPEHLSDNLPELSLPEQSFSTCIPTQLVGHWRNSFARHDHVWLSETEMAFVSGTNTIEVYDVAAKLRVRIPSTAIATSTKKGQYFTALAVRRRPLTLYAGYDTGPVIKWVRDENGWDNGALIVGAKGIGGVSLGQVNAIAVQPDRGGKRGLLALGTLDGRVVLIDDSTPTPRIVSALDGLDPKSKLHPNLTYAFRTSNDKAIRVEFLEFSADGVLISAKPYTTLFSDNPLNSGVRIWNLADPAKPSLRCASSARRGVSGDFHPTKPLEWLYGGSERSMVLFRFPSAQRCDLKSDEVSRYKVAGEEPTWRAGAFHPEGHTFAALEGGFGKDVKMKPVLFFFDVASGALRKRLEVPLPDGYSFLSRIDNLHQKISYNPYRPRFLAASMMRNALLTVLECP